MFPCIGWGWYDLMGHENSVPGADYQKEKCYEQPGGSAIHLIAFSEEGLRAIRERLEGLRVDAGALGVYLFDQSGQLLTQSGQAGEFDMIAFRALLANTMNAASEVSSILRDSTASNLYFYEGESYEAYATQVRANIFLSVLIRKQQNASRIGMVWLYLRRAITDLCSLIEQAQSAPAAFSNLALTTELAGALDEVLHPHETPGAERTPSEESAEPAYPVTGSELDDGLQARSSLAEEAYVFFEDGEGAGDGKASGADLDLDIALLEDPNAVLTYEQARALGLVNLDDWIGKK
jgi:hypothetical protein